MWDLRNLLSWNRRQSFRLFFGHVSSAVGLRAKRLVEGLVVVPSGIVSFWRESSPSELTDRWKEGPLRDEMTSDQGRHHHKGAPDVQATDPHLGLQRRR